MALLEHHGLQIFAQRGGELTVLPYIELLFFVTNYPVGMTLPSGGLGDLEKV